MTTFFEKENVTNLLSINLFLITSECHRRLDVKHRHAKRARVIFVVN